MKNDGDDLGQCAACCLIAAMALVFFLVWALSWIQEQLNFDEVIR